MENKEINLSKLWKQQTSISPDLEDLKQRLSKYKKENLRKRIISNITLGLTIVVILGIWILYDADTIFPMLGMSLIITAIGISLIKFNQFYSSFKDLNKNLENKEYLESLLEIQKKQKVIQTSFMNIYFSLLTLGLVLYLYEFTLRMDKVMAIVAYGLTLGWIVFVWFYLKPKMVKKQNLKLEQYINSIQNIINSED